MREYQSLSLLWRIRYRVYRHPMVLFGLGPIFLFAIHHRIPAVSPFRHRKIWGSILGTDAALAAIVVLMLLTVGGRALMLGYLPVILLAATTGIWLFYIQHQFEYTYWAPGSDWNFHAAALNGSSFYDLPAVLHWLTGYIGFHHIHHVCSKIPNYRLRECFDENPEFRDARRLTLLDSLNCARLSLWDEERQLLVPFRHASGAVERGKVQTPARGPGTAPSLILLAIRQGASTCPPFPTRGQPEDGLCRRLPEKGSGSTMPRHGGRSARLPASARLEDRPRPGSAVEARRGRARVRDWRPPQMSRAEPAPTRSPLS